MKRYLYAMIIAGLIPQVGIANVSSKEAKATRIKDINKKPASFLNKEVTIRGEIQKKISDRSFILNGEGLINDEIMVISKSSITSLANPNAAAAKENRIEEDDEIQVVGTVRRMTLADVRREYSLDFDPQIEVEFEGTFPVLIAENIQMTDKD